MNKTRVIPRLAKRAEGPHSRRVHYPKKDPACSDENTFRIAAAIRSPARSLAVCAARDDPRFFVDVCHD
jgi:hypothetical protein